MAIEPKTILRAASRCFTLPRKLQSKPAIGIAALAASIALLASGLTTVISPPSLQASDHDDGDVDVRSRALSLTDLYVFREVDQNPAARSGDLILVMNTNPRSLARQQYFFSNQARYEFKVSRVTNVNSVPTGIPDLTLQFTFDNPIGRDRRQRFNLTVIDGNGRSTTVSRNRNGRPLTTTPILNGATPTVNQLSVRGANLSVFAGLREDPFFFDVEQFFRVRAGLLGRGDAVGFRPPETAVDFAAGYNVNSIVVRIPQRLLRGATNTSVFDVWETISIRDSRTGQFTQVEQLARPAVNEGLFISQGALAWYNKMQPSRTAAREAPALAAEAKRTLLALGNSDARANALLGAFLPDVMRIDTNVASGYANALNTRGAPVAGRLLTDDVIDITLAVLTQGAVTTDNVSYEGQPGNPYQGHDPLVADFPYLALPN